MTGFLQSTKTAFLQIRTKESIPLSSLRVIHVPVEEDPGLDLPGFQQGKAAEIGLTGEPGPVRQGRGIPAADDDIADITINLIDKPLLQSVPQSVSPRLRP